VGYLIDFIPVGTLLLIIYIIYDFFRHKTAGILKRIILYSFILYLIYVFQYTTGGFHIPPQDFYRAVTFQPIPFQFVSDWLQEYRTYGLAWFFSKFIFYNLIMLFPLGVYLAVFFNVQNLKKAIFCIFTASLAIETYQIIFSYFGLVFLRTFNVDDLLLNTVGGAAGFYAGRIIWEKWLKGYPV
jgi:glycopeptide antibiotics resistance protein